MLGLNRGWIEKVHKASSPLIEESFEASGRMLRRLRHQTDLWLGILVFFFGPANANTFKG